MMPLSVQRVKDIASGGIATDEESMALAEALLKIFKDYPKAIGYIWRWKPHVIGCSHEWHFIELPVSHIDVECKSVYDSPGTPIIINSLTGNGHSFKNPQEVT